MPCHDRMHACACLQPSLTWPETGNTPRRQAQMCSDNPELGCMPKTVRNQNCYAQSFIKSRSHFRVWGVLSLNSALQGAGPKKQAGRMLRDATAARWYGMPKYARELRALPLLFGVCAVLSASASQTCNASQAAVMRTFVQGVGGDMLPFFFDKVIV